MSEADLFRRYVELLCTCPDAGLVLDMSRMGLRPADLDAMAGPFAKAFEAMAALEAGAVANVDEGRRVGHYWLRAPDLAPDAETRWAIEETRDAVVGFAGRVHDGAVRTERGERFEKALLIGIGGSALGPQLAADALGGAGDRMEIRFLDNTDPDGFDRVLGRLGDLDRTLTLVVSKSGGTPETTNGAAEAAAAYERAGLRFAAHAVAVTQKGSGLWRRAGHEGWLGRFPMWDFVGGRTSITSAAGLLPMALQGLDVAGLLEGARRADEVTRVPDLRRNPAALMAAAWLHATGGRGGKQMVVLPYKDRLLLLGRYLQQLVMESLGKERDLAGVAVHQGLAVYGNKGSTDQHAYVQQLRDGDGSFFVVFVQVLEDRAGGAVEVDVEPGITAGDYLLGFLLGTREALRERGRPTMTLTLDRMDAAALGALVALFERVVGFYATLVGVNAYDQPGVEAGKRAAAAVLDLQRKVVAALAERPGEALTLTEIAARAGSPGTEETIDHVLRHLVANRRHGIRAVWADQPEDVRFFVEEPQR